MLILRYIEAAHCLKTFEIIFAAKGDEETKGKNNTKSTKKLLVYPSIQEFNNTITFLEKDPACQSVIRAYK